MRKRPKLLLLDEPLGALDKKLREETQYELMDLQQTLGLTFVVVTHDQEEAMTVADRIAVMDKGKLVQVSTPTELYEQPNCKYVADFIGDINLIEGNIAATDGAGNMKLEGTGLSSPIDVHSDTKVNKGDKVWLALRPEKIRVSLDPPANGTANSVEGSVYDIGYLGDTSVYHVKLPSGATIRTLSANTTRLVERPIGWDDKVWLSWSRDSGVLLTK